MIDMSSLFLQKAVESLTGAQSELINRRYNNVANRAYYACYLAAVYALTSANVQPRGAQWSHEAVPASFDGQLINRRKLYPASLRGVLDRNHQLRLKADYRQDVVTGTEASRALQRAEAFVAQIRTGGGERQ
jgi:uncharacterized protein (UPF0332 family)